jgi:stearoyl-CoA desaturase (delta-9 desaturase)
MANSIRKNGSLSRSVSGREMISMPHTLEIIWRNVVVYIYLHLTALYGFYLCFTSATLTATLIWGKILIAMCSDIRQFD